MKLLLLLALLVSLGSFAQFEDYSSDTEFGLNEQNDLEIDPELDNPSTGEKIDKQRFGSRPQRSASSKPKDIDKYVKLNPETGYGPEIIKSFDFDKTSLEDLTKHMQKLTGINLIKTESLKGDITIKAPTPITVGDAWRVYQEALHANGYTIIRSGNFYKIVDIKKAQDSPIQIYTGKYTPQGSQYIMKVIKLKHVGARNLFNTLRRFFRSSNSSGKMNALEDTNAIIVSDLASNIRRIESIVRFLDVPGHKDSMHIIKVRNTSAEELVQLLNTIIEGGGSSRSSRRSSGARSSSSSSRSRSGGNKSNITRLIAEPRTGSIIALANSAGAAELRSLVKRLDVPVIASGSGRIHVYYLKHGSAEQVSQTLQSLLSSSGGSSSRGRSRTSGSSTTGSGRSSRFTRGGAATSTDIFNGDVRVSADTSNNALVITASPSDWDTMRTVLDQLDIPQDQVLVEGIILEMTASKQRQLGTSLAGATGEGALSRLGSNVSNVASALGSSGFPVLPGSFAGFGLGRIINLPNPVAGGDPIQVNSVSGLVQALATDNQNNVLATPYLTIMNNEEGEFSAGETIQVQQLSTATTGTQTTTFTELNADLRFQITPQINRASRMIRMEIQVAVEDFQPAGATPGAPPNRNDRELTTNAVVRDKDLLIMGGLLQDQKTVSQNKVPFLGDIPVLGWLFKTKANSTEKTNILFMLSPQILSPYETVASNATLNVLDKSKKNVANVQGKKQRDILKGRIEEIEKRIRDQRANPSPSQVSNNNVPGLNISEDEFNDLVEEIRE